MPHQYTESETHDVQGVWLKLNGRKFCDWCYNESTGVLKSRRGVVIRTAVLESKNLTEVKEKLPRLALNLANQRVEQDIDQPH